MVRRIGIWATAAVLVLAGSCELRAEPVSWLDDRCTTDTECETLARNRCAEGDQRSCELLEQLNEPELERSWQLGLGAAIWVIAGPALGWHLRGLHDARQRVLRRLRGTRRVQL